jgi:hypothetical protein
MAAARRRWRSGDGSAAIRGWTAFITLGLPAAMRDRRRDEVAADLDEERLDAIRTHRVATLRRQRLGRLLAGIPDDLVWRLVDARIMARDLRRTTDWVPLDRWTTLALSCLAVGVSGGFALVGAPLLTGQLTPSTWQGWGPIGFTVACIGILVAILVAVPWPGRAATLVTPAILIGFAAAPWLWGCWTLAAMAIGLRWYQSSTASG